MSTNKLSEYALVSRNKARNLSEIEEKGIENFIEIEKLFCFQPSSEGWDAGDEAFSVAARSIGGAWDPHNEQWVFHVSRLEDVVFEVTSVYNVDLSRSGFKDFKILLCRRRKEEQDETPKREELFLLAEELEDMNAESLLAASTSDASTAPSV